MGIYVLHINVYKKNLERHDNNNWNQFTHVNKRLKLKRSLKSPLNTLPNNPYNLHINN